MSKFTEHVTQRLYEIGPILGAFLWFSVMMIVIGLLAHRGVG